LLYESMVMKGKNKLERMELRAAKRFNRRSKKIKFHLTNDWSWTFPIPKEGIPKIVEEIFGNGK